MLASFAFAEETGQKQEKGYEAYSLGEIYVSEKTPITQQTTVTNVITAEDMKATNSRTVAEALSYTPGLRVTVGAKNEPNVSIHGVFDQTRILVLVDGVPYYETKAGKLDLNQFTTDNVAKIEVTKGAASALYGANAMGGVINIITKQASGKPYYSVNLEGGDVDYYKVSASHGMKKGIFSYWLNYDHRQAHGWRMSDDFRPFTGRTNQGNQSRSGIFEDGGTRNQSDYKTDNIWAKFGITPSAGSEYFLSMHYNTREKGNPSALDNVRVARTFANFFRFARYDDWGIDLSGQQKVNDKLSFNGKVFYHNHVDGLNSYSDWNFSNIIARSNYYDYMIGGSLIGIYQPVDWNTLRISFNYRGDSHKDREVETDPFNKYFSYLGSVGFEDEIRIGKNFSGVLGGSYDWFKVTEAVRLTNGALVNGTPPPAKAIFNPMAGATYQFTDGTKLFGSVAHKSRFPTLQQLFSANMGNDRLKPENAVNLTVGASRSFGSIMWGEFSFFYHDISDFITKSGPSNSQFNYVNTGKVRVYGLDMSTEFYPVKDLVLKLGYNYNNAKDESGNRVTDRVTFVPEHKIDMGVSYTAPVVGTRLDLNGILMGEAYTQLPTPTTPNDAVQSTAGWFILNLRLSQKFLKHYEAYLAVNNVFDRDYQIEYSFPGQGRNIFGGITAHF
jgi:outer membrane receptor protein involved in Fe transport